MNCGKTCAVCGNYNCQASFAQGLVFILILDANIPACTVVGESETELHQEALFISPLH